MPIVTPRLIQHPNWFSYVGKWFEDKGYQGDKETPAFAAGEFVVQSVAPDNNFLCRRMGSGETLTFDISYAINRIRKYEED